MPHQAERNHYKKLKHVKSVIDTFPPKGRSRKGKKVKESNERNEGKASKELRARSCTRPPTGHKTRDFSKEKSKSLARNYGIREEKHKNLTPSNELIKLNFEHHEYLQFSLRITEDIIKNDLYSTEQMKQVLHSHFEANKGRLEQVKMEKAIIELCKELNIPPVQSCISVDDSIIKPNKSEKCICPDPHNNQKISLCECANERIPPIPCWLHENTLNKYQKIGDGISTPQIQQIMYFQVPEESSNEELSPEEAEVTSTESSIVKIVETQTDVIEDDQNSSKLKCDCSSLSCIPDACDAFEEILKTDEEVTTKISSEQLIDLNDNYFESVIESELEIETDTVKEVKTDIIEVKTDIIEVNTCDACSGEDKLKTYLEFFDKEICHARNVRELGCCTFTSSIEPANKENTHVQTSQAKFLIRKVEKEIQTYNKSKNVIIQSDFPVDKFIRTDFNIDDTPCNRNDYVRIEGPIYIPKCSIEEKLLKRDVGTYVSKRNDCTPLSPPPKQELWYARDCDLTPQRDILKSKPYMSPQCHCEVNKNNLLLTDQYLRYNENLQHFYPSIATQVSSTQLLNEEVGVSSNYKYIDTKDNYYNQPIITLDYYDIETPLQKDVTQQEVVAKTLPQKNVQVEVETESINSKMELKEIPEVPEETNSYMSIDKRIRGLRTDMDKYRDGYDDFVKNTNRIPSDNVSPRDRSVSICGDVHMISSRDENTVVNNVPLHGITDVSTMPRRGSLAKKADDR